MRNLDQVLVQVRKIVSECDFVRPMAFDTRGSSDDGTFEYQTFAEQMHFVERYTANQLKASNSPFAWLNSGCWSDPQEIGNGVVVSVCPTQSVWTNINLQGYLNKKTARRKSVEHENPTHAKSFDSWWNVVQNIESSKKSGEDLIPDLLGAIGFLVELQLTEKYNLPKGSKVARQEVEQLASESRVSVQGVGDFSQNEKAAIVDIFITKCCNAHIVNQGEETLSLKSLRKMRRSDPPRPRPEPPRPRPEPSRPRPEPPHPRPEPPRPRPEPPHPRFGPQRGRENPSRKDSDNPIFAAFRNLSLPKRVIVAAGGAALAVFVVIYMRDSKGGFERNQTPRSVRTYPKQVSENHSPVSVPESDNVASPTEPEIDIPSETPVGRWEHPKAWYASQCRNVATNLKKFKTGGYEYQSWQFNAVTTAASKLNDGLRGNDPIAVQRLYDEMKRAYDAFVANCSWRQGLRHSTYDHVISSSQENVWSAEDGYEFVNPGTSDLTVRKRQAQWSKPKDWFLNECNVMAKNVEFFTSGGYRYDRSGVNSVNSKIRSVRNFIDRNDADGTTRAYMDLKSEYQTFVNGCEWQPNLRHPRYQHVISANTKNQWTTESGWEFVNPGTSDFSVRRRTVQVACRACGGTRYRQQAVTCPTCNGRRKIANPAAQVSEVAGGVVDVLNAFGAKKNKRSIPRMPRASKTITCPGCNGQGRQYQQVPCNSCNGTGVTYQNAR